MHLHDLPRVVWALAAARFVSSAASFTMLFLTLHLAAMRNELMRRRLRTMLMMQAGAWR